MAMSQFPKIPVEAISALAFAPFGDVLVAPAEFGRTYYDRGLTNARISALPSLSVARIDATKSWSLTAVEMERHEFSSQTFIPIDVSRYLIVVAPHGANGGPDVCKARGFIVPGSVGITYGVNVWHHPITVLDRAATFAVQMWRDGSASDEEFVKLDEPFQVEWSEAV